MRKTIYLYRLTDYRGDQKVTVVNDPSDNGCIGGYGKDGQYHQYDSYELYYAYDWAEKFGMKLECTTLDIEINDSMFAEKK